MNERKKWMSIVGGALASMAALGYAVHTEQGQIDVSRAEIAQLKQDIQRSRETISKTAGVEREVIVLRELSEVIDEVLPATEELTNLINDFRDYAVAAGVEVNSFKHKPTRSAGQGPAAAFDRVSYTLSFNGGTFEFLDFLSRVESDDRFMSVPSFTLNSGTRKEMEENGQALHQAQVDVETYVFTPAEGVGEVRIDGYARKRDLLAGSINTRRRALRPARFEYRGDRGRRDPWIDPRVPDTSLDGGPSIQEQVEKVEQLILMMAEASSHWEALGSAVNTIDRMLKRGDLDVSLARLDEELRRVDSEGLVTYLPAAKSLELEVIDPRSELRRQLELDRLDGPSRQELEAIRDSMLRHAQGGEWSLAIDAYATVEGSLSEISSDPIRENLRDSLTALAEECAVARDFYSVDLDIGGAVILEGHPPKIIVNSRTHGIGDLVAPGLEIAAIRPEEVVFFFRGFELTRVY